MEPTSGRVVTLLPVFNDWEAVGRLLAELDAVLASSGLRTHIVLLDDGSTVRCPRDFARIQYSAIDEVDILHLRRNLGHQRAIAVGLVHIQQHLPCDAVVIMDGDGEDRPDHVPVLLHEFAAAGGRSVIFAARTKRMESAAFRFLYHTYKVLHRALTGIGVRVGNFSVCPWAAVQQLVVMPELWNHYAAAVFRSRMPYETVPLPRGRRYAGESRMNFIQLMVHGLSAISVFGDVVGVRLLALASVLILGVGGLLGVIFGVRFATSLAIPGWATFTTGILVVILLQAVMFSFLLAFFIVNSRIQANFLPVRDCPWFAGDLTRAFRKQPAGRRPDLVESRR